VEILRQGIDWEDWRLGIQVAINGHLAPMFDLHKSHIAKVGDGTEAYEKLLADSAQHLISAMGPARTAGIPASQR